MRETQWPYPARLVRLLTEPKPLQGARPFPRRVPGITEWLGHTTGVNFLHSLQRLATAGASAS